MQLWLRSANSSSRVMRRLAVMASLTVTTSMPLRTGMTQLAASLGDWSTSTTHRRHPPQLESAGWWHRVGMSIPCCRAASKMVTDASTVTCLPSMVIWMGLVFIGYSVSLKKFKAHDGV
jgi:hypothetical protein